MKIRSPSLLAVFPSLDFTRSGRRCLTEELCPCWQYWRSAVPAQRARSSGRKEQLVLEVLLGHWPVPEPSWPSVARGRRQRGVLPCLCTSLGSHLPRRAGSWAPKGRRAGWEEQPSVGLDSSSFTHGPQPASVTWRRWMAGAAGNATGC